MKIWMLMLASGALALSAGQAQAGDPASGKEKSATCQACHGPDGNSPQAQFPRLAGQYEDYLLRTLRDYKSGDRQNPIMAPLVATLSEEDMKDLAAYFASQTGLNAIEP
ncbi:MAG: c-type cytochrome [Gammaproteobacteria bacterium]